MKPSRIYTFNSVDADYFRFLNACLAPLADTTVSISAIQEQEYRIASRSRGLAKLGLRLRMYVNYPLKACTIAVFAPANSVLIASSSAFYLPFLIALVGAIRGYQTIHLVYDLYPDALEVAGVSKPGGAMTRLLGFIARLTPRLCDSSVYLGQVLRLHAEHRWSRSRLSDAIHIGVDADAFREPLEPQNGRDVTFHYGGQLGYMHDGDTLSHCVRHGIASANEGRARFNFMVSGSGAEMLRVRLANLPVEICDALPAKEWRGRIRDFQVGLVSLSPGGATVCIPSKTYAMMAGGLAILAICPLWSDLADLVLSNDAGWVINNSPYHSLGELQGDEYSVRSRQLRPISEIKSEFATTVAQIVSGGDGLAPKRVNARAAAITKYGLSSTAAAWRRHLECMQARAEGS